MKEQQKPYALKQEGNTGDFDYIDQDGVSYQSPYNWLFTGILGGCGCGSSDTFAERAYRILDLFATPHEERTWSVYDNETDEVIAHWLDSVGLTEHGSSVAGAWLSGKGVQVHGSIKKLL